MLTEINGIVDPQKVINTSELNKEAELLILLSVNDELGLTAVFKTSSCA